MDRWKAEVGRVKEEKTRKKKIKEEKSQKKKDAAARKGRKVANHSVFQMICGSGGSKSWLAKAAGAEPSDQMRNETRWSPRTRMLTRMLMVQMSKHMVMQSRTIPFCNSLFEQSCACFACYLSAVWSGKCRVWSVECEVRSVECKVWSGECRVCKV